MKNITIYTGNNCAYCLQVKKYLGMKKLDYDEINVDEQPEMRAKAIELSGARTVPVTVVTLDDDSLDVTVGYNLAKLSSAIAK